jgi:hypothetical protein
MVGLPTNAMHSTPIYKEPLKINPEFFKFSQLPLELREQIWRHAIDSKAIEIRPHDHRLMDDRAVLAVAHASQESRRVYQTSKDIVLGVFPAETDPAPVPAPTLRINISRDVFLYHQKNVAMSWTEDWDMSVRIRRSHAIAAPRLGYIGFRKPRRVNP